MKKIITGIVAISIIFSMTTSCFAGALSDWQAKQAQIAAVTAQIQQASVLAQTDASQVQVLQVLQAQLAQLQNEANALQPAAVQELQAQQVAAAQAQQQAAMQAQQAAAIQAQQAAQAQQIAAAQQAAQQQQIAAAQQAAALKAQQTAIPATSATSGTTVYITDTGSKYHSANCRTLKKSKYPISLSDAQAKGYQPCGICQ